MTEGDWSELTSELRARQSSARDPHSAEVIEKARRRGRLTVRERIAYLCDDGSFVEYGALANGQLDGTRDAVADGVVTGTARINGIAVCLVADDGLIAGGSRGSIGERKAQRMRRLALKHSLPYIALQEGSAARINESIGVETAELGQSFAEVHALRGQVPVVGAIMGSCFGGPAFLSAMSDFVPMVRDSSFLAMSGPPVVRAGTGQSISQQALGGHLIQAGANGIVDVVAPDELECLDSIRRFIGLVGRPIEDADTAKPPTTDLERLIDVVPDNFRQPYDVRQVLTHVLDGDSLFELKSEHAQNIVTALGRLGGMAVGCVASQPEHLAGILDADAARKAAGMIQLCDRLGIPILFLQDVPGFLVGAEAEGSGQIREAVALLEAVMNSTTPKITLIMRKSYGLSHLALGGREFGVDFTFAWPAGELGMMGPEAAARVLLGKDADPDHVTVLSQGLRDRMDIFRAAEMAYVDDLVEPDHTRETLLRALEILVRGADGGLS